MIEKKFELILLKGIIIAIFSIIIITVLPSSISIIISTINSPSTENTKNKENKIESNKNEPTVELKEQKAEENYNGQVISIKGDGTVEVLKNIKFKPAEPNPGGDIEFVNPQKTAENEKIKKQANVYRIRFFHNSF